MFERIFEVIRKEFRQVFRDPRARGLLFGPPVIQLIIFGFAVNLDVEHVRTAWVDRDRTAESRDLRAAYEGSAHFRITREPKSEAEISDLLDRGRVDLVVAVERGFGADLLRGQAAHVQILVDGSNSNTAAIVSSYAQRVLARFAADWAQRQKAIALVAPSVAANRAIEPRFPRLDVRSRVWFNPNLRSRDYFVPGVVVMVLTIITMSLTALALVREKEIGTMEQLLVTPLRPVELMLGKTLPFALVGLFDCFLITVLALVVFHVPLRGSVFLLFFGAALYLMTTLGMGLFVSVVSHTQQQAMMLSFFFMFPVTLLSGFSFPVANMPPVIQWLTYLNPMRYFLEIVRAVFLKGVGLDVLWPKFVMLFVLGATILGVNSVRFHKRLE
jgi:ABC-2 type transport system permease protein